MKKVIIILLTISALLGADTTHKYLDSKRKNEIKKVINIIFRGDNPNVYCKIKAEKKWKNYQKFICSLPKKERRLFVLSILNLSYLEKYEDSVLEEKLSKKDAIIYTEVFIIENNINIFNPNDFKNFYSLLSFDSQSKINEILDFLSTENRREYKRALHNLIKKMSPKEKEIFEIIL